MTLEGWCHDSHGLEKGNVMPMRPMRRVWECVGCKASIQSLAQTPGKHFQVHKEQEGDWCQSNKLKGKYTIRSRFLSYFTAKRHKATATCCSKRNTKIFRENFSTVQVVKTLDQIIKSCCEIVYLTILRSDWTEPRSKLSSWPFSLA